MLIRPGECTQCKAQYHLPADFAHPRVKCPTCAGIVTVGEPQDVAELVAVDEAATSHVASAPAPTLGEAAAQLASAALDEVTHVGQEIDAAIDSIETSAGPAATNAFAIAGHANSPAAQIIKDADAVEARVEDIEDELELLELDDEELPAASHSGPAPLSAGWSPAALERSASTLEPRPSRRQGGTLERLKAERLASGAPAAAQAKSSAPSSASRPSTLERLKAERAAIAATAAPLGRASTAAEAPRSSTLERLKAERTAAAALEVAPVSVAAVQPARDKRRARNEERAERTNAFSREEQRKRNLRNSLIGLAVLALSAGGLFAAWKSGYFEPPAPVVPPAPVEVAPTAAPMFDSNFLFGETPTPTAPEVPPAGGADATSERAPSLEDAARAKLAGGEEEVEDDGDQP